VLLAVAHVVAVVDDMRCDKQDLEDVLRTRKEHTHRKKKKKKREQKQGGGMVAFWHNGCICGLVAIGRLVRMISLDEDLTAVACGSNNICYVIHDLSPFLIFLFFILQL
jgi:hypothetical protein